MSATMTGLTRRGFVAAGAATLTACAPREKSPPLQGGWVGDAPARGHRLRDGAPLPAPAFEGRAALLIVGGGVAGLAAARAARRAGIDDLRLFELHDSPGGNSRGHAMDGLPCPLGAHYLPTPGPTAREVSEWLHELGVARHELGRTVYDERHLCHSPQERLFFEGAWHAGTLPPAEPGSATGAQYRRFGQLVSAAQRELGFALPSRRAPWTAGHEVLDRQTFAAWLDAQGLTDPRLRWYLDYACRDDYGADSQVVSAWAGLHYFASRHGFHAPGDDDDAGDHDAVLTWPQGNAWLVSRLAAPLGDRLHAGCVAQRLQIGRHDVVLDLWNEPAQRAERWRAPRIVLATPLFVAERLLDAPPEPLRQVRAARRTAPWLVANLRLRAPLIERLGAPLAWDNVIYGSADLGYVNAQHQALAAQTSPPNGTLLTVYEALAPTARAELLRSPWEHWAARTVDGLAATHPDLRDKLLRIDLARHGHAMSIPVPGLRGHPALQALAADDGRLLSRVHWAHADLAGYSVFEEAFTAGDAAGRAAARALHGARALKAPAKPA